MMRFHLSTLLPLLSLAGTAVSMAIQSPSKRQTVSSVHGTIEAPASGTAIGPGETFSFQFSSVNLCQSGYNPISVWLLDHPASEAADFAADSGYVYQFGNFTIANYGLPPMNPPPSTFVMPETSDAESSDATGPTYYLTVVETYLDCPGGVTEEYGITSNPIVYSAPNA